MVASQYVVNENFTAQHMRMKRPQDDIFLADGLAYMVEDKPYQNHVSSAPNNKEVCHLCSLKNCEVAIVFDIRGQLVKTTEQ